MSSEAASPEVVVEALGVPVGIPVTGDAAARLRRQWSRALTDRDAVTVVRLDHLRVDDEIAHDYAVTSLVTMAALEATTGRRINLHAGAVADERGRVLALVGPSGAGKTTATRLLATRLGYLSDETMSVDETWRVHGHPKPLSVIADPAFPRAKQSLSPDEIGLRRPPADARLHRLVLLHRGDDDAGLVALAPAYAIGEVVAQSSSLLLLEQPLRRLAELVDTCGGAWRLHYREIDARVDDLVALLDRDPQPRAPWVHHPGRAGEPETAAGAWRRAPWLDAVAYDDELVVMIAQQVRVLAGLGRLLWLALEVPRARDELVAETVAAWGEHPDAEALVDDALALLAGDGLLLAPPR